MKKIIILAICSFLAAVSINFLDKQIYPLALMEEIRVVPQKKIIDFLCLDNRGFVADLLFVKVNLHSGSLMWKPLKFGFDSQWSYQMMDLITDLDPKYYTAYLFSGMGLIHNFDDVKLARPIIEKGMKVFPERWELPFWLGYDYYIYLEDYDVGGEYLWRASQNPNAPKRFFSLLLSVLRKDGSYERGLWVLRVMVENAKDERLKMVYTKKLIQLENLAFLQKSVKMFTERKGRLPLDINELVKGKIIKKIPDDPMGMNYEWDKDRKRVVLTKSQKG